MNSEIVGNPTDGSWGVVFQRIDALPRHPVQLYEAACYFVIFAVLLSLLRTNRSQQHGFLLGLFLVLVFSARFVIEFFKTPQASYEAGNMISVGQWLSVPFVLAGVLLMYLAAKRHH